MPNLQTARLRAEMIIKVRCGLLTARQAVARMGVSRKTFYKWEQRGFNALLDQVTDQPPGRRAHPSYGRIQDLEKQLVQAHREIELLNRKMVLKDVLMKFKLPEAGSDRAKKNKRILQVVAMIEEMKTTFSLSYACLANQAILHYRTLMRWKRRLSGRLPAVEKRGSKKVRPLNLTELKAKIRDLDQGSKRTHGTGKLHAAYGASISRRELNQLVFQARRESNDRRKAETFGVSWLRPNLAWAVGDCRKSDTTVPGTLHLHNLTDLCSRYKLPPIASGACGEEVAGHLAYLFGRFGPPLFCKRDNGGNLNHSTVNEVLENAWVIPINNPPNMASYNGAIERTQREFKDFVKRWQWKASTMESHYLLSQTATHEMNHTPRRCLENRTACRTYFGGGRIRYSKRERRSIFRWIRDLATEIADRAGRSTITNVEWRIAAKQWLLKNSLIKIEKAGKCHPI